MGGTCYLISLPHLPAQARFYKVGVAAWWGYLVLAVFTSKICWPVSYSFSSRLSFCPWYLQCMINISPHYQTMVFKSQIQGCKFILYWWILLRGLVCKPREVLKVSPLEKSEERLKNGNSFLINSYLNIKCCTVLNTVNTKYTKLFTCWKYLNSGKNIQKIFIVRKSSVSC